MQSWPIAKDPDAVLDYYFDWSSWREGADTIATVAILLAPGAAITINSHDFNGGMVRVWISGGVAGTVEFVTCRVTSTAGRTDDMTNRLRIRQN